MRQLTFIDLSKDSYESPAKTRQLQTFRVHSHAAAAAHRTRRRREQRRSDSSQQFNDPNRPTCGCSKSVPSQDDTSNPALNAQSLPYSDRPDLQVISQSIQRRVTSDKAVELRRQVRERQQRYRWSSSPDPKSRIHGRYSALTLQACEYYAKAISPVQYVIDDIFEVDSVYTPQLLQLMLCADEFGHLGSINAALHCSRTSGNNIPIFIIENICKAINHHRKHIANLKDQGDDIAVIMNLLLTSVAEGMGDLKSVATFSTHLRTLVAAAGGLEQQKVVPVTKRAMLQWESCFALALGTRTVFADSRPVRIPVYPKDPMTPKIRYVMSTLPEGFRRLAHQGHLSYDVVRILARCAAALDTSKGALDELGDSSPSNSSSLCFDSYLESCPVLSKDQDTHNERELERFIVLTAIVHCFHSLSPCRVTSILYRACKRRLVFDAAQSPPQGEDKRSAFLWCRMNAIDATKLPDSPMGAQAVQMVLDTRETFPEVTTKQKLEEMLGTFFCNDNFLERSSSFYFDDLAPR